MEQHSLVFPQRLERNTLFQENRQHDGKMEGKKELQGQNEKGTTGEGLSRHGNTAGQLSSMLGKRFCDVNNSTTEKQPFVEMRSEGVH